MTTKLAQLIADKEGFGKPGAIPTTHHNPGDLRHAIGETHKAGHPNDVGWFATDDEGWAALERQLSLFASRNLTLQQAIYSYAPPEENDSAGYLDFLCKGLNCTPETTMTAALQIGDPPMKPTVSAAKVGSVAAGTYAGTLLVGALNHFMAITMPDKYEDAVIGLCVMVAVHFLPDSNGG